MNLTPREMHKLQFRGKVIGLTRLCIACEEVPAITCTTGGALVSLWKKYCEEHVGLNKRCSKCPRTLAWCPIETQNEAEITKPLKYCNRKRKFRLPINLIDFEEFLRFDFTKERRQAITDKV